MQLHTQNMHKICSYIDFDMQNMLNICTKYADVKKICKSYAQIFMLKKCTNYHQVSMPLHRLQHRKYAENMQKKM